MTSAWNSAMIDLATPAWSQQAPLGQGGSMQALRFAAATVLVLATFAASPRVRAAEVKIDRAQRFQTIDGFGFFGAHDVWWGQAKDMANAAWFDMVIGASASTP
jgi:O-glycosyl hydrolase